MEPKPHELAWNQKRYHNLRHAEYFHVLHSLTFILFTCIVPDVSMHFQSEWKTVLILISWLRMKPADPDLQCFQNRMNSCSGIKFYGFV